MAKSIAIKIDSDLLRDIHIRAAECSISTQQYITGLMERDLYPERFPQLNEEQRGKIRDSMQEIEKAVEAITDVLQAVEAITDVLQEEHVPVEGGPEMTMGP